MTATCCPRCLLISANDAETPFAQRADMTIADGILTWTLDPRPLTASGFRVTVMGDNLQRVAMTILPFATFDEDPFTVSWDTTQGRELLYLGDTPIAAAPAIASGQVASIEIGFAWMPTFRDPTAAAWLLAYDAEGRLLRRIQTLLPLDTAYLQWKLTAVETTDSAYLIQVSETGSNADPCCPPPPIPPCNSFETDAESAYSYIARGLVLRPAFTVPGEEDYHVARLNLEAVVRTTQGASFYAVLTIGDCCNATAFEISLEPGVPAAYLRFMCSHGGPQVLATFPLTGASFRNTAEPVEYTLAACIRQERYYDGEENIIWRTIVTVYATDTDGRQFRGTAEGQWLIVYGDACLFDANGLVPHLALPLSLGAFTTAGIIAHSVMDACPCDVERHFGASNECLDDICLGGYHPPEEPTPTPPQWALTFANLPAEYQFGANPEPYDPESGLETPCAPSTTTESTSAEGNQHDPQNVARTHWITEATDAYISANTGLQRPTGEVFCNSSCWGARFTAGPNAPQWNIGGELWKPLVHLDHYTANAEIPLFLLVEAWRREAVNTASGWVITYSGTTALLGAVSPYPNCSQPIEFEFLTQDHKTDCFVYGPVECPELPPPPDLSQVTATLTPI